MTTGLLSAAVRLPGGLVRPRSTTAAERRIIAVDGEGNDIDGRHSYTLLAAADDAGWRDHIAHDDTRREGDSTRQPNYGLPTRRCLDFLLSLPRPGRPSDLVLAFAFVYDAVKILSDLPLPHLQELAADEVTDWEGYRIEFRPRKFLTISEPRHGRITHVDTNGKTYARFRRQVTVFDAFGYFQSSFVAALESNKSMFGDDERAMIEEIAHMKRQRSQFENEDPARILAYCYSEVELLAKMMRQVIVGTEDMPISPPLTPRSFHGSSAIGSVFMRSRKITNRRGGFIADPGIPPSVVYGAYFGGRFESSVVGRAGDCHAYDINSAYPAAARNLPCLAHATARRVTDHEPGKIGVYLVGSHTSGDWAPFPIRIDKETADAYRIDVPEGGPELADRIARLTNRQVLFAHEGRRWMWSPEVEAARRHFGADAIPIYDGWVLDVGCDHRPFAEIDDLYALRRQYVDDGDGRQMVIKLLINSVYGKLAQHVGTERCPGVSPAMVRRARRKARMSGQEFDPVAAGLVRPPDTLCVIWAGLITSHCRASVLDAIYRSGHVIAVATDGIIATEPIDGLASPGKPLGEWEHTPYRGLSIYGNGVYDFHKPSKGDEWVHEMKSRGFSPRDITARMLSDAWDSGVWDVYPCPGDGRCGDDACDPARHRVFVPLRQAMGRVAKLELMGQWVDSKRPQTFRPSKRHFPPELWYGDRPSLMPTTAYTLGPEVMSLAYEPKMTWEEVLDMGEFIGSDAGFDDDAPDVDPETLPVETTEPEQWRTIYSQLTLDLEGVA